MAGKKKYAVQLGTLVEKWGMKVNSEICIQLTQFYAPKLWEGILLITAKVISRWRRTLDIGKYSLLVNCMHFIIRQCLQDGNWGRGVVHQECRSVFLRKRWSEHGSLRGNQLWLLGNRWGFLNETKGRQALIKWR